MPRYSFIAQVQLVEPTSDTKIDGRVSEISSKGCYIDVPITLPAGTLITLKILRDQGTFATNGKIIYVQEGMGMGVAFLEIADDQLKILDSWLAEIAG
ncbi:MAG: PilZ domain-containing protein [Candidatus Acidiferrales bacterium]